MELHLQHREMIEVVLPLQGLRLAANRHGDRRVVLAVDLVGLEALQEIDRLVEAGLDLGKAVVLIGEARQIDARHAPRAQRMVADLTELALEREHVGIEPQIEHGRHIPFLLGGVRLAFLQHGLEPGEQLHADRHKAAVKRDRHGTSLLCCMGVRERGSLAGAAEPGKACIG